MPRSDEAEAFISSVYLAVQEIPYGRVTSYGHIAKLIDRPNNARQVGQALKHLPITATNNTFHNANVPWQRVVSFNGKIPRRDDPSAARRHAQRLRGEGVVVAQKADGELYVDLHGDMGWFPEYLPSEEEED